jgi:hypothetical protein
MRTNLSEFRAIARSSTFEDAKARLEREGMSSGRAILFIRNNNPESYNAWMEKRQRTDNGRLMQYL